MKSLFFFILFVSVSQAEISPNHEDSANRKVLHYLNQKLQEKNKIIKDEHNKIEQQKQFILKRNGNFPLSSEMYSKQLASFLENHKHLEKKEYSKSYDTLLIKHKISVEFEAFLKQSNEVIKRNSELILHIEKLIIGEEIMLTRTKS
jgi:hypothetical protein